MLTNDFCIDQYTGKILPVFTIKFIFFLYYFRLLQVFPKSLYQQSEYIILYLHFVNFMTSFWNSSFPC